MNSEHFKLTLFSDEFLIQNTSIREGEVKIGEKIKTTRDNFSGCKFIILGISEDFGPQANEGKGGTKNAFSEFLPRFLSIQSNEFLDGEEILFLGEITSNNHFFEVDKNEIIRELDEFVFQILTKFIEKGKVPIVIGGGHNNAYPIIKSISSIYQQKINVINLDAHADFRKRDFRHSGNPFSYAFYDGFIDQYVVLGLHQSYNNQYIIDELRKNECLFSWFDDYIINHELFEKDLQTFKEVVSTTYFGIELDMDSIAFMPSSAMSPSGFSIESARKYICVLARQKNAIYLHLPEASPQKDFEKQTVGKSLAYFVSDFIKNRLRS